MVGGILAQVVLVSVMLIGAEVHPLVVIIGAEVRPLVVIIGAEVHPLVVPNGAEEHPLEVAMAHALRMIFAGQMNVIADPERTPPDLEETTGVDPRTEERIVEQSLLGRPVQSGAPRPFSHRRSSTEQMAQLQLLAQKLWSKSPSVVSAQFVVQLGLWCRQVGAAKVKQAGRSHDNTPVSASAVC